MSPFSVKMEEMKIFLELRLRVSGDQGLMKDF